MINLGKEEFCREIERFAPNGQALSGMINLDIAVFGDNFTVTAALWKHPCDTELFREALDTAGVFYSDIKNNYRYPNKNWKTLSKRSGRKVCKTGYPVYGTVEELNQYKYLAIKLGNSEHWGDKYAYLLFRIDIELTKDNPVSGLDIHIKPTGNPGVEIWANEPIDTGGANQYRYVAGEPIFPTTKKWEYTELFGTNVSGKYFISPEYVVRFEPAVKLYAQNMDRLCL